MGGLPLSVKCKREVWEKWEKPLILAILLHELPLLVDKWEEIEKRKNLYYNCMGFLCPGMHK